MCCARRIYRERNTVIGLERFRSPGCGRSAPTKQTAKPHEVRRKPNRKKVPHSFDGYRWKMRRSKFFRSVSRIRNKQYFCCPFIALLPSSVDPCQQLVDVGVEAVLVLVPRGSTAIGVRVVADQLPH